MKVSQEETNPEASDHLKENIVGPEDTKSPIALDNPSVATPVEELEENKYIPRLLDAAGNTINDSEQLDVFSCQAMWLQGQEMISWSQLSGQLRMSHLSWRSMSVLIWWPVL